MIIARTAVLRRMAVVAPVRVKPDLTRRSYWASQCRRHKVPYQPRFLKYGLKGMCSVARMIEGFPVRFRMYVSDRMVVACSNYHRHRALDKEAWVVQIIQADCWTRYLCEEIGDFTTDWLVLRDGRVVMIAGGPAHTKDGGAGSCCFVPGQVSGIAMENRN